jgi:predicted GNAT family acetyltransferase
MSAAPALDVQHDPRACRLSATVEGYPCEVDYRFVAGVMTITHTGVPGAVRGRGIAGQLVRAAFELARSKGWRVVPACSYAAVFVRRYPEYADLLA